MTSPPFSHDASLGIQWPPPGRGFSGRGGEVVAWTIAGLLAVAAVGALAKGMATAWTPPRSTAAGHTRPAHVGDVDMREREAEYRCFRRGVYPNERLAGLARPAWFRHSPYPPYALPLFAIFFEPGGVIQGRVLIQLLSAVALVVMGCYGYRSLRFAGRGAAWVGGLAGAAIMGNSTVLELGQFSIICMGLVVGQMMLLERGRPMAAGICWALAMIKPQIAAAFIPLFVVKHGWRGLLAGGGVLGLSGLLSCWWTDVPPTVAIAQWFFGLSWVFATHGQGLGPGALAAWLGVDPLLVHTALIVGCGAVLAALSVVIVRLAAAAGGRSIPVLPLAGVCAVLGELLVYHHHYDNVMLWPTMLAMLVLAVAVPARWSATLATLTAATLWLPHRIITDVPFNGVIRAGIWLAAAAVLAAFIIDWPRRWRTPGAGRHSAVAGGGSA